MEYTELSNPVPEPGEILVEMKSIGLNFADIMRRNGTYPMKGNAPYINGYEGAGIVIDNNFHPGFKPGDRVAFADVPKANAELVAVPVSHAVPLPDEISFETAASVMLQGLTAHYLTKDSHRVASGEIVLIHAAAGGVGQLLIQMCKMFGATVIGLTSSQSKKDIARSLGADAVFLYNQDWKKAILERYPAGIDLVYESVGTTMADSISVTRTLGKVVLFGLAGGSLELGEPLWIIAGSRTITGGDLWDYLTSREERLERSAQLFSMISAGHIKISPPAVFSLSQGAKAHEYMEGRQSTGKILMKP